jgi:hypothetical protein
MIHSTLHGPPRRRIAVIAVPRPMRARLGRMGIIRDGEPATAGVLTTLTDATPDTSDNWIASVIQQQQNALLTTPGTLQYIPAPRTPYPIVAPWNAWGTFNCDAGSPAIAPLVPVAANGDPAQPPCTLSRLFLMMGAVAGLAWLLNGKAGR